MTIERERQRRWAPHLLMLASGFAAMGYEIVWTQQTASWLGHESAAVLAVVAALFGGERGRVAARGDRPAYDPLLSMAMAPARSDLSGARTLLDELRQVQPARSEAIRLLAQLSSGAPAAR